MSHNWSLLRAEVAEDWRSFLARLEELRAVEVPRNAAPPVLAPVAVSLHHAYGAVGAAMTRVSRAFHGESPSGQRWYEDLLASMVLDLGAVRPPILSHRSAAGLRALLGFRHFFRHAYAVSLDPARLGELRTVALDLVPALTADFSKLDQLLGSLPAD